jgi:hypothetical protein
LGSGAVSMINVLCRTVGRVGNRGARKMRQVITQLIRGVQIFPSIYSSAVKIMFALFTFAFLCFVKQITCTG